MLQQNFAFFLGIDPGIKNIGATLLDVNGKVIDATHIRTPKIALCARLEKIASYFQEVPSCCVCYEIQPHSISSSVSIATGYILCTVRPSYAFGVSPKKLKKWISGSGLASKDDVKKAIESKLNASFKNDHVADSAACALYALATFS